MCVGSLVRVNPETGQVIEIDSLFKHEFYYVLFTS